MIRKPKTLGLALLAASALSATAAAPAQAAPEFTAVETVGIEHSSGFLLHALIDGETSVEPHFFRISTSNGTAASVVECTSSTFSATMVPGVGTALTVTAGYAGCRTATGLTVHVRMNGCDYTYRVGAKEIPDLYTGTLDIGCPAGSSIEFESTMAGKRQCLDTIPAQVGIGPVFFQDMTDSTPTDLTIIEEAQNVTNITDNGFLACGGVGIGHHADGRFVGDTTITATNTLGEQVDFEVGG